MNTVVSKLSVREALESSLPFAGDFIKRYWILAVLYSLVLAVPAFVLDKKAIMESIRASNFQLDSSTIVILIVTYVLAIVCYLLLAYFSYRAALAKLDPSTMAPNKAMPVVLFQIFCVGLVIGLVSIPLFILFILPAFWYLIKSTVSVANFLSTNDGIIASIRKSHELMNNRFWRSFGFLFLTALAIVVVQMIIQFSLGLCVGIGGLMHSASSLSSVPSKIEGVFQIIVGLITVFASIIYYYCHAWLYVYLKSNNDGITPGA